jgi:D-arabinose 1-dehydrogenase-like Zn-dependent alcohol dehydrogenase
MGTLLDMKRMITFIISAGIKPEIGEVIPMERAQEAFRKMWQGETLGKTVLTR